MHVAIIGAGGVGCYYGARLLKYGVDVSFIARGAHLDALQKNGLVLTHPDFEFKSAIDAYDMDTLLTKSPKEFDALIVLTKTMSTKEVALALSTWCKDHTPYIISLQNGVENEAILASYINPQKIIGGLSVKIGAHMIQPGVVHAVGVAQTPLGLWEHTLEGEQFLAEFATILNESHIPASVSQDIRLELWKKLAINNGVNAICALLQKKTGEVIHDEKLSKIVLGQMRETAIAAKVAHVDMSEAVILEMFEVIRKFDSIKPSMLVDRENSRPLELSDICGVVIKNCELQGIDAPYTRTISTLLEALYNPSES